MFSVKKLLVGLSICYNNLTHLKEIIEQMIKHYMKIPRLPLSLNRHSTILSPNNLYGAFTNMLEHKVQSYLTCHYIINVEVWYKSIMDGSLDGSDYTF